MARTAGAKAGRQTVGLLELDRQEHPVTHITKIIGLMNGWDQGVMKGVMCSARELRIYM